MTTAAKRTELHEKIDHVDSKKLDELYGLVVTYLDGRESSEEWDLLPELHKQLILKGLEQADAGLGTELSEINTAIRAQYGLNG